jgi:hypothetical protein
MLQIAIRALIEPSKDLHISGRMLYMIRIPTA